MSADWQRNDGFPSDAYFDTVKKALAVRGITVEDSWRDEPWEYTLELGEGCTAGYARLVISWRVDEDSDPLGPAGWQRLHGGLLGWYWVPWTRIDASLGDRAVGFGLPVLAEPDQVADAITGLVGGSRG